MNIREEHSEALRIAAIACYGSDYCGETNHAYLVVAALAEAGLLSKPRFGVRPCTASAGTWVVFDTTPENTVARFYNENAEHYAREYAALRNKGA